VRGVDQIDQVLLGAEARIDAQVIVDVVAVIGLAVVLEDGRQPDGRAAEAGDVIEMPLDAFESTAEKDVTGCHTAAAG
jgi:hypothetical protein